MEERCTKRLWRHAAVLSVGQAVAQLLPFLATPLLARMYQEEELGELSLLLSAVNVITSFCTLKFDFAETVAESEEDAAGLFWLAVLSSCAFGLLLFPAWLFAPFLSQAFSSPTASWVFALPVAAALTGVQLACYSFCIFQGRFWAAAAGLAVRSAILTAGQILLSGWGAAGLAAAQIIAVALALPILGPRGITLPSIDCLKRTARKYKSYPIYMVAGSAAAAAAANSSNFWISGLYSSGEAGIYYLANRVLAAPISLLSAEIGQILARQSALRLKEAGRLEGIRRLAGILTGGGVLLFGAVWFLAPWAIPFFLGSRWVQAAPCIQVQIPLYLLRFVAVPISLVAPVLGRQRETRIWQLGLLGLSFVPPLVFTLYPFGILEYLFFSGLLMGAGYLIFLIYCICISERGETGRKR